MRPANKTESFEIMEVQIMTILEMRKKRSETWEKAKAFLDSHRNESGILSAEDTATYERMEKEIVDLGHEIERQERLESMEREMQKATSEPIRNTPEIKTDEKVGRASDAYKDAFWRSIRNENSYEIRNALREGVDSDGGYLVPDTFEHTLIQALDEENVIRQLAHTFTTSSGAHAIPIAGSKSKAMWVAEEQEIPETTDTFTQKTITAHKLTALIKISEELLNDSAFDLESYIASEFARKISDAEEEAFITGSGTGKPFGILHDKEGAEIGVTAAAANAITTNELIDLYYSLRSPYRKRAVWIMNDSTVNLIRKLKDGNGQYIWEPGIKTNDTDTILGRKVYTTTCMPTAKTGAKAIAFGDISYYWIGDREGISFKRLNELYATKGQVGFLATKRLDARLILPETIKVLKMK